MISGRDDAVDLKQQTKGLGHDAKNGVWIMLPGSSTGVFGPPILLRGEFETDEIHVSQRALPLFVMARQDFTDLIGYQGELGVAFFITGTPQAPKVVSAFIVKGSGLHIDTSPDVEATLENGNLILSFILTQESVRRITGYLALCKSASRDVHWAWIDQMRTGPVRGPFALFIAQSS
ncbi:hypothetical protein N5F23_13510 [Pseudomonas sichuanensis]|uniref:hypothetical protein n=1 Tax=Pseudomonas sichuanensis TaxID=2213015 RepID=UPI00244B9E19|nr:hypothetical protein [Pseudomonas sichuanensis]MDH0729056.1 hypothetical protein [Pseudomonas sichuanensis]MDH1583604.1 hypothetical protein [Pseudomonas sichuanensis]MDH1594804.1 hypothetical protein [Pseudomonas sichuanensis]MDH1596215.1 hypothetical protein [Pseudomonas sichuanensis]